VLLIESYVKALLKEPLQTVANSLNSLFMSESSKEAEIKQNYSFFSSSRKPLINIVGATLLTLLVIVF